MCSGFVPVPLCGKRTRAGRPGEAGVAAGLRLPGWAEGALWLRKPPVCPAGLSSRGQRLPEAGETWLLRSQPRPTATGARPPTPTPLFLWVSSGSRSLFLSPSDLSAPLYIFIFALTPVTAGSCCRDGLWVGDCTLGVVSETHSFYSEHGIYWQFLLVSHLLLSVNDLGRFHSLPSLARKRYHWEERMELL